MMKMHDAMMVCTITLPGMQAGDGDTGDTLTLGSQALLEVLGARQLDLASPAATLSQVASILQNSMGGTSGGLYGVAVAAAAASLSRSAAEGSQGDELGGEVWLAALNAGVDAIRKYGRAQQGYRTMLDALVPAGEALEAALSRGRRVVLMKGLAVLHGLGMHLHGGLV
jgi:dihydroxyacetone kinase